MSIREAATSTILADMRTASNLSSLWIMVLLLMVFRDLHEIPKAEFLEEAMNMTVPDGLFLAAGIILSMPILMVPLSKLLSRVWSRRANLLVVIIIVVGIVANPPGDLDDYWFAALEIVGLAAIAWIAWMWRPDDSQSSSVRPWTSSLHPQGTARRPERLSPAGGLQTGAAIKQRGQVETDRLRADQGSAAARRRTRSATMTMSWQVGVWRQFAAAIDMLDNALRACPDALWQERLYHERSGQPEFAEFRYVAYHILFWLDFYLSDAAAGFAPPPPFTMSETEAGALPDRVYTRAELRVYLANGRQKCRARIETLEDGTRPHRSRDDWPDMSVAELLLYNMRHVQEHAAQLSLFLGQRVGSAPGWVAGTPNKGGGA